MTFTCMHSPIYGYGYGERRGQDRWICHDPEQHFAGEFFSASEAAAAVERWNSNHGDVVLIDWKAPVTDYGGDRGTYSVCVKGTKLTRHAFGMEHSAKVAARLRDLIAEFGLEAFMKFATAFSE